MDPLEVELQMVGSRYVDAVGLWLNAYLKWCQKWTDAILHFLRLYFEPEISLAFRKVFKRALEDDDDGGASELAQCFQKASLGH